MIQKIKNFFKWVWGNKQALISILGSLLVTGLSQYVLFSDILLQWDFFVKNTLALQITGGVLTGLFLINLIYTIINKYGLENLNEIKTRVNEVKENKANRLTKEQREAVKNQYKFVEGELKKAENKYAAFKNTINNFNALQSIAGYSIPSEKINEYNDAMNQINNAKIDVDTLKKSKEELHNALKK